MSLKTRIRVSVMARRGTIYDCLRFLLILTGTGSGENGDKNCGVKMAIKEEPKNDLRSSSCVLVIGRCFKRDPTFLDSTERQFNLGELKRSISASTHIVTLLKSDYRVFGE